MCVPVDFDKVGAVVATKSPAIGTAISPTGRRAVKRLITPPSSPEIDLPAQQQQPGATPPPTQTKETRDRARTSIREEESRRLSLTGRRATILTGGAGLQEPPTTFRKTLLGA